MIANVMKSKKVEISGKALIYIGLIAILITKLKWIAIPYLDDIGFWILVIGAILVLMSSKRSENNKLLIVGVLSLIGVCLLLYYFVYVAQK
ncbi:hypothetical protein [Membranihabitans maritimus]|uniref:hypothetical protein n=1 Tax=Membranihabitans maritimus TaxID=2904244 RepID=UPI001F48A406|nr:hypothetical protein [Membranihabitans maritimus]